MTFQIFISTPSAKTTIFEVDPDTLLVKDLKKMIQEREGIDVQAQRLIFSGKQMDDEYTLSHYKITEHSTVKVVMRLLGGKI